METGCVNVFCLSLFLYATTCNAKLRFTKHFRSSQLPALLVLPLLEFVPSFIHSSDIDAPLERGGVGEDLRMEAFLGMTESHRIPHKSQLRPKSKALLQCSIMHRFSGRDGGSENAFVAAGEFANVCNGRGDGVPRDRTKSFGAGFSSLEAWEAPVSNHSRSTSTKTDLPGPHLRSLTQNL